MRSRYSHSKPEAETGARKIRFFSSDVVVTDVVDVVIAAAVFVDVAAAVFVDVAAAVYVVVDVADT